jgi:hypothetical protein
MSRPLQQPVEVASPVTPQRPAGHGQLLRWLLIGSAVVLLALEADLAWPTLTGAVSSLSGAQPAWVVVAVLAAAASMSMFARSRRRLMQAAGVHVPARSVLAAVYVGNAIHVTIPGGAAFSTAYTYGWMRSWGASRPAVTWTLASGGVVASVTLAAMGLFGSLLVGGGAGLVSMVTATAAVLLVAVAVHRLQRRPEHVLAISRWVLARVNAVRRRPLTAGADALDEMAAQLRSVRPRGADWSVATAFAIANWAFDVACLAASGLALGLNGLTLPLLLVAYTAGMAASGISLLPGGIGVVDAALVLTLVAGGIPAAAALPAVLLYRLISLVGVVVAGWAVAAVQARAGGLSGRPTPAASLARDENTLTVVPAAGEPALSARGSLCGSRAVDHASVQHGRQDVDLAGELGVGLEQL